MLLDVDKVDFFLINDKFIPVFESVELIIHEGSRWDNGFL